MTPERASELVGELLLNGSTQHAIDLFTHFVDYFGIPDHDSFHLTLFASMCGFAIASDAVILDNGDN